MFFKFSKVYRTYQGKDYIIPHIHVPVLNKYIYRIEGLWFIGNGRNCS